jgi:hypothetical protein
MAGGHLTGIEQWASDPEGIGTGIADAIAAALMWLWGKR